jgi:hypothetical protein
MNAEIMEIADLIKSSFAVGFLIIVLIFIIYVCYVCFVGYRNSCGEENEKIKEKCEEWHFKHFDGAYQFTAWMNDPKTKPVNLICFGPEDFIVFPLGKDGFDVVYRD